MHLHMLLHYGQAFVGRVEYNKNQYYEKNLPCGGGWSKTGCNKEKHHAGASDAPSSGDDKADSCNEI